MGSWLVTSNTFTIIFYDLQLYKAIFYAIPEVAN